MAKYIWRQIDIWFWVEGTRGTKATNIHWTPKTSFDFWDKIEVIEDESALWLKLDTSNIDIAKKYGQWTIEGKLSANSIGYLLYSMLWNKVTTEQVAGKVFEHLFTINNESNNPSLTIFTNEPNGDFYYPLALIESLTISANVWEFINVSATFKSKMGVSETLTASYETDYQFKARHSLYKLANVESWLASANEGCIESFELNFTKENIESYCLNSDNEPIDIIDWKIGITWSITTVYNDKATYREPSLAWTQKSIMFALEDDSVEIEGEFWAYPLVEFVLPKIKFTDYQRDNSNDDIVKENISFKVIQNDSTTEAIKVTVQNSTADYI